MEIEIRDYHQQNYVCTLKRAGDEYVLTDNAGIRVGYCKSMPSGTGSRQCLQLFWNDGTQFGKVERKLGLSSDDSVDSIRISGSVDSAHGGDALGARISDEIPVSEVDDEDLIKLLFGYVPSTDSNQKADLHGIGSGGSGTKDEGNGDKAGQKKGLTKASLPIIIIAALGLMCIVGLILWLTGRSRSNEGPTSEAQPTAAPSFTARPSVTDTLPPDESDKYASDDFVVDGVFYIQDAATRTYIGVGGEKKNSSGVIGRYIDFVNDKSEAVRFTPVSVEGSSCRLATYDIGDEPFYLDAYNSREKNYGADLWGRGTDRDQRWILEKQGDGLYCIYLESNTSLCLTSLPSVQSDLVSVADRDPALSDFQQWFLVLAD